MAKRITQEQLVEAANLLLALLKFVDAYIPEAAQREKSEQLARSRRVADSIIAANGELAKGKPVMLTLELDPVTALAGTLNFIMDTAPDDGRTLRQEAQPFARAIEFLSERGLIKAEKVCEVKPAEMRRGYFH
jgi:hypothetical protein